MSGWLIMNKGRVTEAEMGAHVSSLREDRTPNAASSLLADSLYLSRWRTPPDHVRGLLLAAIACEVRAKDVLLSLAPTGSDALMEFALRRARPSELFDTLPKQVAGRSLKDSERDTFKRIARLFELRNDIAHWARFPPDAAEVRDCLGAAEALFRWFEELEVSLNEGGNSM
jgi:hypothetical protein